MKTALKSLLIAMLLTLLLLPFTAGAFELPEEGDAIGFRGYVCKTEEARDTLVKVYSERSQQEAMVLQKRYYRTGECGLAQGRALVAEIGDPVRTAGNKFKIVPVTLLQPSPGSKPYYTFLRFPNKEIEA